MISGLCTCSVPVLILLSVANLMLENSWEFGGGVWRGQMLGGRDLAGDPVP